MKRKPDAMIALIALFFVGLIVSGFSSLTIGSSSTTLSDVSSYHQQNERTVSR